MLAAYLPAVIHYHTHVLFTIATDEGGSNIGVIVETRPPQLNNLLPFSPLFHPRHFLGLSSPPPPPPPQIREVQGINASQRVFYYHGVKK